MMPASRVNFRKLKERLPTPPPLFPATTFTKKKTKMASRGGFGGMAVTGLIYAFEIFIKP